MFQHYRSMIIRILRSESGTVLMEKQLILAVVVVGVFGLSSLMLPWFQQYLNDTSEGIQNAGKPNSFRSVNWK